MFFLLQSVAFQTWEILNSMELDSKLELKALLVDGGMTNNELLMQTQADFLGRYK
jgi:glycerol kinase